MITKEIMEQYERVRKGGLANMLDYYRVVEVANMCSFDALGSLTRDEYKELLQNFGKLMKKYDIKQER